MDYSVLRKKIILVHLLNKRLLPSAVYMEQGSLPSTNYQISCQIHLFTAEDIVV